MSILKSWRLLPTLLGMAQLMTIAAMADAAEPPPNIVILFADDLGYGDLGCYGHPSIRTPNLDRMAAEGLRFTDFYAAESVCTPSRAALLTGRLPVRSGMCSDRRRVLFPDSAGGLPANEITMAEALKSAGYVTACIGKWHLGHLPGHLPTRHGFDEYFGLPYSNDMDRTTAAPQGRAAFLNPRDAYWNVPLLRNDQILERPARQEHLTRRYTEEALEFIRRHKSRPFFLYFPHTFPHVPLFASDRFKGRSARGLYGDAVEELDWSVGQVLAALRREGVAERTLVFFTSDNGPWLTQSEQGGSAGLLHEGKGSTWEGGMREPAIAWWPGRIGPGRVTSELGSTLDLFATSLKLAGAAVPEDRVIDGVDLSPLLFGTGPSPRDTMFFYRGTRLYAVRHGSFKAHWITQSAYGPDAPQEHNPPLLYHLGHDPSERFNVADRHPEILDSIVAIVRRHQAGLISAPTQLESLIGSSP
ncbi:MAG: sulfatase [Verrucomicrobia bacterium]|nr:sulfatase [Verrucomicrobiota bacterium]